MDIVSGTVHATPSLETSALVIALATYRVFARSAPGRVQPAAGRPVAAGAVPVTAVPCLDGHARVLELLLLLLEQPPAIRPAATTSAAPATAGRRPPTVLASLLMAHAPGIHVLEQLSHHDAATSPARGKGGTTHPAQMARVTESGSKLDSPPVPEQAGVAVSYCTPAAAALPDDPAVSSRPSTAPVACALMWPKSGYRLAMTRCPKPRSHADERAAH